MSGALTYLSKVHWSEISLYYVGFEILVAAILIWSTPNFQRRFARILVVAPIITLATLLTVAVVTGSAIYSRRLNAAVSAVLDQASYPGVDIFAVSAAAAAILLCLPLQVGRLVAFHRIQQSRRHRPSGYPGWIALLMAAPLAIAATGVSRFIVDSMRWLDTRPWNEGGEYRGIHDLSIAPPGKYLLHASGAITWVFILGGISIVPLARRLARVGIVARTREFAFSTTILICGAVAFASNWGRLFDALHPIPDRGIYASVITPSIARVNSCPPWRVDEHGALLTLTGTEWLVDGSRSENGDEASDKVTTLCNNRRLVHPGDESSQLLIIVADGKTPVEQVLGPLAALERGLQDRGATYHLAVLSAEPSRVQTASLGDVSADIACLLPIKIGTRRERANDTWAEFISDVALIDPSVEQ